MKLGSIEVDVDDVDIFNLGKALQDGIENGMRESAAWMQRRGERRAKQRIINTDRIWRYKVLRDWKMGDRIFRPEGDDLVVETKLHNVAPHAAVVDKGVRPAGELENPDVQVQDIIKWVSTELDPTPYFTTDGGPSGGGPDNSGLGKGFDEWSVEEKTDTSEVGVPSDAFQSEEVRRAVLDDGTDTIWKSEDRRYFPTGGPIRHEVVWSRAQERLGWDLGPRSRYTALDLDDKDPPEIKKGVIQEFVENAEPVGDRLETMSGQDFSDEDDKFTRIEFLDNYDDDLARIAALDYLLGNNDRHRANMVLDDENELHAIDNGGAQFDEGLDPEAAMRPLLELGQLGNSDNPEELTERYVGYLDKLEARLEELANDQEWREEIIERAETVHGEDHRQTERLRNVLGFGLVGPKHFLFDDGSGTPRFKREIQEQRERIRNKLDRLQDPDEQLGNFDNLKPSDETPLNEMIDDELDDIFGDS